MKKAIHIIYIVLTIEALLGMWLYLTRPKQEEFCRMGAIETRAHILTMGCIMPEAKGYVVIHQLYGFDVLKSTYVAKTQVKKITYFK